MLHVSDLRDLLKVSFIKVLKPAQELKPSATFIRFDHPSETEGCTMCQTFA